MNPGANRMDSTLTSMWVNFFTAAGIPSEVGATYSLTFTENRIQSDMLLDLNKEYLFDMGITRMGDVIAILRHAKQVHESAARERVLSSAAAINKVPVAAVTGRATVAQPTSPASRILEHYTRNPQVTETAPVTQKRKVADNNGLPESNTMKKARLIRFGNPVQTAVKSMVQAAPAAKPTSTKQTVFARLGNSEGAKVSMRPVSTVNTKPESKPIFSRLGSKTEDQALPVPRDALKYEGILKSNPLPKKVVTITSSKNVRKIACTMRADEAPVSVKEKLALPKAKSVKFSNTVQYKEIEGIQKPNMNLNVKRPLFSPVFNKPERRLSMPEGNTTVKERLGIKKPSNLTITKNVFNRLGV